MFSVCWYLAMRLVFERRRAPDGGGDVGSRRGRLYAWIVWAVLIALTGIVTAGLLDLVDPLVPDGDWHWLIGSLFVIVVWRAQMWSLRPFLRRYLPA